MVDHVTPSGDQKTALQAKIMRDWAKKHDLPFFDVGGRSGICHALISEIPLVFPGQTLIMGDSHTCTAGALCTLSVGVGTTDLGVGIVAGFFLMRPQKVIRINLLGELPANVYPKDVILNVLKQLGKGGAKNCILEFHGGIKSMAGRLTISNMTVEGGGTCGMWMVDKVTVDYLWPAIRKNYGANITRQQVLADLSQHNSDDDCKYDDVISIDLSTLKPSLTINYHPSDVVDASSLAGKELNQIVIGSCTNARLEDLRVAAKIMALHGGMVNVRTIVIPATQYIYGQAVKEGLITTFIDAGCCVTNPTCGPCLGMSCGVIVEGEVCLATTNRNYAGRMGKGGMVHLASPATAAFSAMFGKIAVPSESLCKEVNRLISIVDQAAPLEIDQIPVSVINYSALSQIFKSSGASKIFSGKPFYLPREKVNTDEIIPAKYLTEVDKKAFGQYCLEELVKGKDRVILRTCRIIVSDIGFGDGSSREQAPWALEGIGIICVIAKSFERIFEANFSNTGNLAITLPAEVVDELFKSRPDYLEVIWNTDEDDIGYVRWGGKEFPFAMSELQKSIIRKGGSTGVMFDLAAKLQTEGKI
jgi:3-isopropylmalate/(R)-2-methylmalate dehydratase large subunit